MATITTPIRHKSKLRSEENAANNYTSHNVEIVKKAAQLTEDELFDLAAPPLHKPVVARLLPLNTHVHGIDLYQNDSSVILGRSKELIPPYRLQLSAKISAKHCEFHVDANSLILSVRDLSSNGTFVNGQRIAKKKWVVLKDKDHIALTRPAIADELKNLSEQKDESLQQEEHYKMSLKLFASGTETVDSQNLTDNNDCNNISPSNNDLKNSIEFIVHRVIEDKQIASTMSKSEHVCSVCNHASEYMYMLLPCQHVCCKHCKDNNVKEKCDDKNVQDRKEKHTFHTEYMCPKCNSLVTEELKVNIMLGKEQELSNVGTLSNENMYEYSMLTTQEQLENNSRVQEMETKPINLHKRQRLDDRDSYDIHNSFSSNFDGSSKVSNEDDSEIISSENEYKVRHGALHYYNTMGKLFAKRKLKNSKVGKIRITLTKPCSECKTASTYDHFKCVRGQSHLVCHTCIREFPERPFCERKQRCELCNTPYCSLYYNHGDNHESQLNKCKNKLMYLKEHKIIELPPSTFAGNLYEQRKFLKFINIQNTTLEELWKQCLERLSQHKSISQISANLNLHEIKLDSIVCRECANQLFASLLLKQANLLYANDENEKILKRPNCWNGLQCERQYESLKHAKEYNHICLQTKRKE